MIIIHAYTYTMIIVTTAPVIKTHETKPIIALPFVICPARTGNL